MSSSSLNTASVQGSPGGKYLYTVHKGEGPAYEFDTAEEVFVPTATSRLLIEGACRSIQRPAKVLDLGCGIGVCGMVLAKLGYCQFPVYLSDISERAVEVARGNAKRLEVSAVIRQGSLFTPWKGERFDVIVDDVSGVSEEIARLSPWFPAGVECQTGRDGTALVVRFLEEAAEYLKAGGLLLFPVLSLSNEERILEVARSHFENVSLVLEQSWFLPEELLQHLDKLESLREAGIIHLEQKFGAWLWSTKIYKAGGELNDG